jgi:hypothetical protein
MNEETFGSSEWEIPAILENMGGRAKLGPIEVVNVSDYGFGDIVLGRHKIEDTCETNTGHLFRFFDGEGERALKTFLKPDHSYLVFEKRWQRLWSIAAEFQSVARSQADWSPEERTHLGIVGVQREDNFIHISEAESLISEQVEPGLLMRWIPEENNLMNIFINQNGRFSRIIPESLKSIRKYQRPLIGEDALFYCGADGVSRWIDSGNLINLRISPDEEVSGFAENFWREFSYFVENNRELLDERALTSGIYGNGDTKLANAYAVGDKAAFIDPTTFPLISMESDEGFVVAPFPFHDQLSELSYFTVYMSALEKLAGGKYFPQLEGEEIRKLKMMSLNLYREIFEEDASDSPLSQIYKMYEAGYASVEYEINLGRVERIVEYDEQKKTLEIASALREVAMEDILHANQMLK